MAARARLSAHQRGVGVSRNRIAVRFAYSGTTTAAPGFEATATKIGNSTREGLMAVRIASINDLVIAPADRKYRWALGRRPDDHPSLSDLGL